MKVIKISDQKIIIRHNPVLLWLFGIVFFLAGLFLTCFLGRVYTLECHRSSDIEGVCIYNESIMFYQNHIEFPVSSLRKAYVDDSYDSDSGYSYRVVIVTDQQEFPFSAVYSSGQEPKVQLSNEINRFINNNYIPDLVEVQDDRGYSLLFGGIFSIVGFFVFAFTSAVTIFMDKTTNTITIMRKSLLRKAVDLINIDDIDRATVEESSSEDGTVYRVEIIRKNGDPVALTAYYSSGFNDKKEIADLINNFLSR